MESILDKLLLSCGGRSACLTICEVRTQPWPEPATISASQHHRQALRPHHSFRLNLLFCICGSTDQPQVFQCQASSANRAFRAHPSNTSAPFPDTRTKPFLEIGSIFWFWDPLFQFWVPKNRIRSRGCNIRVFATIFAHTWRNEHAKTSDTHFLWCVSALQSLFSPHVLEFCSAL